MVFQERTYAVLLVSSSEKFCEAIRQQLPGTDYWPVDSVANCGAARRSLPEREYDLILINAPLKDEFGTQFAFDCCEKTSAGVILFVKNELYCHPLERRQYRGQDTLNLLCGEAGCLFV